MSPLTAAPSSDAAYFDLSDVISNALDCHTNEFYLSVKHGAEPLSSEGGEISLHERHNEFDIYKITHDASNVVVKFK